MVKITELSEREIDDIGEAFADHVYGDGEKGMSYLFSSRESLKEYICGYARAMIKGGFLYSTSEAHKAFIAYKYSGDKFAASAGLELLKTVFRTLGVSGAVRMLRALKSGGKSYEDIYKKTGKPYIFVGMLAVRKQYQGQGFMRKAMEIAFEDGRKRNCPVILDTDAELKRDKYAHLGMKNVQIRKFAEGAYLYDMVKEN